MRRRLLPSALVVCTFLAGSNVESRASSPGRTGEDVIYPNYAKADTYPESVLRRIRTLYGAGD